MSNPLSGRHPSALVDRSFALPLEGALIVLGLVAVGLSSAIPPLITLSAWVAAAVIYLVLAGWQLHKAAHDHDENVMEAADPDQLGTWSHRIEIDAAIVFLTALLGTVAAIPAITAPDSHGHPLLSQVLGAVTIICSWLLLQIGWSRLYADLWFHGSDANSLDFPDTKDPGLVEFAYFTFSMGATFQTSDTSVTSTHMRWLCTIHAVISFFYNSILLALAISIITGR